MSQQHEYISAVVVVHALPPTRLLLRVVFTGEGYAVTEVPTYDAALRHLRACADPTVVVAGNFTYDYQEESAFFGHVAADAALARRHRFVLLSTIPEWLPLELDTMLFSLGVPIVKLPCGIGELLTTVGRVAGRTPADGPSAR